MGVQELSISEWIGNVIEELQNEASDEGNGRARALTITKLEEAKMWAEKI